MPHQLADRVFWCSRGDSNARPSASQAAVLIHRREHYGVPRRNRTLACCVRSAAAEVPSAGTNWGHVRDSNPSHQSEGLAAYPRSVTWHIMVGAVGIEPTIFCMSSRRSTSDLRTHGTRGETRTLVSGVWNRFRLLTARACGALGSSRTIAGRIRSPAAGFRRRGQLVRVAGVEPA